MTNAPKAGISPFHEPRHRILSHAGGIRKLALVGLLGVGNAAFAQVSQEVKGQAEKALETITMRCPDGRRFVGPLNGGLSCKQEKPGMAVKECRVFIELKDVTIPPPKIEELSPADVANGIEKRYHSVIKYPMSRYRYVADGNWDKWEPWHDSLSNPKVYKPDTNIFGGGSVVPMIDMALLYEGFSLTQQNGTWSSRLNMLPFTIPVSGQAKGASCSDMENGEAHLGESRTFKNQGLPVMTDGFRPDPVLRQGDKVLIPAERAQFSAIDAYASRLAATLKAAATKHGLQVGAYDYQAEANFIVGTAVGCLHGQMSPACRPPVGPYAPAVRSETNGRAETTAVPNSSGISRGFRFAVFPINAGWMQTKGLVIPLVFEVLPGEEATLKAASVDLNDFGEMLDSYGVEKTTITATHLRDFDAALPSPISPRRRSPETSLPPVAPLTYSPPDPRPGVPSNGNGAANDNTRLATLGEVVDPKSKLMWTLADNGKNVDWKNANAYCQALRTGGYSDWRLPQIQELASAYSPSSTRTTAPLLHSETSFFGGQIATDPAGSRWDYHINGGIILTGPNVWSRTSQARETFSTFFFSTGKTTDLPGGFKRTMRALCVRSTELIVDLAPK